MQQVDINETLKTVATLPFWMQIIAVAIFLISFCCILWFGVGKKWTGIRKYMIDRAQKDEDAETRIGLYNEIKAIDARIKGKALKHAKMIAADINVRMTAPESCSVLQTAVKFTLEDCLIDWIEANSIISKAFVESENVEANELLNDVKERYQSLRNSMLADCHNYTQENVPRWSAIKDSVKQSISGFYKEYRTVVKSGIEQKLEIYAVYENRFQSSEIRKNAVIKCVEKNRQYLRKLTNE